MKPHGRGAIQNNCPALLPNFLSFNTISFCHWRWFVISGQLIISNCVWPSKFGEFFVLTGSLIDSFSSHPRNWCHSYVLGCPVAFILGFAKLAHHRYSWRNAGSLEITHRPNHLQKPLGYRRQLGNFAAFGHHLHLIRDILTLPYVANCVIPLVGRTISLRSLCNHCAS